MSPYWYKQLKKKLMGENRQISYSEELQIIYVDTPPQGGDAELLTP